MVNDVIKDLQGSLEKAIEAFRRDLAKVRTGRANLAILDGVRGRLLRHADAAQPGGLAQRRPTPA